MFKKIKRWLMKRWWQKHGIYIVTICTERGKVKDTYLVRKGDHADAVNHIHALNEEQLADNDEPLFYENDKIYCEPIEFERNVVAV